MLIVYCAKWSVFVDSVNLSFCHQTNLPLVEYDGEVITVLVAKWAALYQIYDTRKV